MNSTQCPLPPFLEKLRLLVSETPANVASWNKEGSRFVVHSSTFTEGILSKYFNGNLKTFVRQLHFYGFRKQELATGGWCFFHPCFLRDQPELISEIKRKNKINAANFVSKKDYDELKSAFEAFKSEMTKTVERLSTQLAETRKEISRPNIKKEPEPLFSDKNFAWLRGSNQSVGSLDSVNSHWYNSRSDSAMEKKCQPIPVNQNQPVTKKHRVACTAVDTSKTEPRYSMYNFPSPTTTASSKTDPRLNHDLWSNFKFSDLLEGCGDFPTDGDVPVLPITDASVHSEE